MYDKILLTTDGSESSEAAVKHAVSLAEKYGSEIHILYVSDVRSQMGDPSMEFVVDNLEEIGKKAVEAVEEQVSSEVETVTSVEPGIPHREIISYSEDNDIDLICMATHGRSGLDRILIGSVTEKVTRKSKVPVMTVPVEE
jgi:nucleotide-binding universal stress UspA family protein